MLFIASLRDLLRLDARALFVNGNLFAVRSSGPFNAGDFQQRSYE
jgi:hypothetical protein